MTRQLLDDARPGARFQDSRGSIWEYLHRAGTDEEMLFPHILRCLDTGQEDSFTPGGQDEYALKNCCYPLVMQVP